MRNSLDDLEKELDDYRSYLKENKDELDKECIRNNEDSVLISDFGISDKLPNNEDIFKKSLFLNRYVIDDPLHSVSYKNLHIINNDRKTRGFEIITDEKAKEDLWKRIQYMKNLLPGIHANIQYIKFYPLSNEPTNELLNIINLPDLSFPEQEPEIYEWFLNKVIIKTVDENKKLVDLIEPCKKLGIQFENDNSLIFLPAFLNFQLQNVVPSIETYRIWKQEEIVKSIRDRYIALLKKNEFRMKFGAIVSTDSQFEFDFLNSIISQQGNSTDLKALQVISKISLPFLSSTSFEKVMDVRQFFDDEFENFRKQLKQDVLYLQITKDQRQLEDFSNELSAKYESAIKEIHNKIKLRFNLSGFDLVPTGIDITTMITTTEPTTFALTGINVLYKTYEAFVKNRKEAKNNQCYFLYKLK